MWILFISIDQPVPRIHSNQQGAEVNVDHVQPEV